MKILVFSINYPTAQQPSIGIFVYKLMQEFIRQGHEVVVVTPRKITLKNIFKRRPFENEDLATVYNPLFLSLSNKNIFSFNTYKIGVFFRHLAARKAYNKLKKSFNYDIIYSHFMSSSFMALYSIEALRKPMFLIAGETPFGVDFKFFKTDYLKIFTNPYANFIALSTPLKEDLIKNGVNEHNILVSHNATDKSLFFKRNKKQMRMKYNIPLDKKIIITIGKYSIPNKGVRELLEAMKDLDNVKGIFLSDEINPEYIHLSLFNKRVSHNLVPELLACADLFVLLTSNEGSSNATVEAMSCGLPMIVSAIPELIEQCDPSFALFVNRNDINEIRNSIESVIYDDEKLEKMGNCALNYSRKYSLDSRAKKILSFIEEKAQKISH